MNLGKKYKQLFEGKTRSNDSKILKEAQYNSSIDSDDIFFLWDKIVDDGRAGISHGKETETVKQSYSMFSFEPNTKFQMEVEKLMKKNNYRYELGDDYLKIYES